jgi:hypothetical protein
VIAAQGFLMSRKTVYRTDAREYAPGGEMTSYGDHRDWLLDDKKAAEDAIREQQKPGEQIRETSLYTYADKAVAGRDYNGIRANQPPRHLYELEIEDEDINHAGDLIIYYEVIADIRAKRDPAPNAKRYWTEAPTKPANTEYLVKKAVVVRKLLDAGEKVPAIKRAEQSLRDEPENEEFYKTLLQPPENNK